VIDIASLSSLVSEFRSNMLSPSATFIPSLHPPAKPRFSVFFTNFILGNNSKIYLDYPEYEALSTMIISKSTFFVFS